MEKAEQRIESDFTTVEITVKQIREHTKEKTWRKYITIETRDEEYSLLLPHIFNWGYMDDTLDQIKKRDKLTIKVLKSEIDSFENNKYFYLLQNGRRNEIAVFWIEKQGEILYEWDIHEMNPNDKPIENIYALGGIIFVAFIIFAVLRGILIRIKNKLKWDKIN